MRPALASFAAVVAIACSAESGRDADLGPCEADRFEPNDSASAAAALGAIRDDDDVSLQGGGGPAPPKLLRTALTTHAAGEIDWFTVDVNDTGLGGNPKVSVIVSAGYEATAWWQCVNGTTESVVCGRGTAVTNDPELAGRGCTTPPSTDASTATNVNLTIECAGTSTDNGKLTVRVRRLAAGAACERYTLTVSAE